MSELDSKKVVSLESLRNKRTVKEKEEQFKTYLRSLKKDQLQSEANFLVEKMEQEKVNDDILLKSALLMDELARRVSFENMSDTISQFATDIREHIPLSGDGSLTLH